MRFLVLAALTVISVGCKSADKADDVGSYVYELPEKYRPLLAIKERPSITNAFASPTAITTIGEYAYVKSLDEWLGRKPPNTPEFDAVMLHEQVHSIRQHKAGITGWVAKYTYDREFMWAEEQRGWYVQIKQLRAWGRRVIPEAIASSLSKNYANLAGKMVTYEEALAWVTDVLAGRWHPDSD